jgi:hypothetical protein
VEKTRRNGGSELTPEFAVFKVSGTTKTSCNSRRSQGSGFPEHRIPIVWVSLKKGNCGVIPAKPALQRALGLRVKISPRRVGSCKAKTSVLLGNPVQGERCLVSRARGKRVLGIQEAYCIALCRALVTVQKGCRRCNVQVHWGGRVRPPKGFPDSTCLVGSLRKAWRTLEWHADSHHIGNYTNKNNGISYKIHHEFNHPRAKNIAKETWNSHFDQAIPFKINTQLRTKKYLTKLEEKPRATRSYRKVNHKKPSNEKIKPKVT